MDDAPPVGGSADRDARIDTLAKQAEALNQGVAELMQGTGTAMVGLAKRGQSNRRWIMLLALSLALDVVLTVGLGVAFDRASVNAARVDHLSSNVRTQLCGVLQLLVNADTPTSNALAKARGDDMAARAASFTSIHKAYAALDCGPVVKP